MSHSQIPAAQHLWYRVYLTMRKYCKVEYDRVAGVALSFDFSKLEEFTPARPLRELQRFMILKALYKDTATASILSPSAAVDKIWHKMLLFPRDYFRLCNLLLLNFPFPHHAKIDRVIDHNPEGALKLEEKPLQDRYDII